MPTHRPGLLLLVLAVGLAGLPVVWAGDHALGDAIPIVDVTHTDPARGTTHMKDATLTFVEYEEHAAIKNQLLTTTDHMIEPKKGKFVVVRYQVVNNADQVLDSWPVFFGGCKLMAGGESYGVSKVSGQFAQAAEIDMQGRRIAQGETLDSCLAFDVPAEATPESIVLDLIDARVSLSGGTR